MSSGQAKGADHKYQKQCRDFLTKRFPSMKPFSREGIDISMPNIIGTNVTFDILLKDNHENLIAAECKRWQGSVDQGKIIEFAFKCEGLRKSLKKPVMSFFFAKSNIQIGGNKVAHAEGIHIVVFPEKIPKKGFTYRFETYDPNRELRLKAFVSSINEKTNVVESIGLVLTKVIEDYWSTDEKNLWKNFKYKLLDAAKKGEGYVVINNEKLKTPITEVEAESIAHDMIERIRDSQ